MAIGGLIGSGLGSIFGGQNKAKATYTAPKQTGSIRGALGQGLQIYAPYKAPQAKATYQGTKSSSAQPWSGGGGGSSGGGWSGGSSSSGGGGGDSWGGGGGGGGDGGGASALSIAAPAPVMEDVVIPDAKADTDYQRTVTDLAKAMSDFQAQQTLARNQYDTGWSDQKRRLGWNETTNAFDRGQGAYGDAVYSNENDFAGRGMLKSGPFAEALAAINRDFADRKTGLDTDRTNNVNTAAQALSALQGQQGATTNLALQDAINRIASKYAVTLEQAATPQTITREKVG